MHNFLSAVGAFTILILGGGWVFAQLDRRKYEADHQRELRTLDNMRRSDPANAELYTEEMQALLQRGPRRTKLFG